MKIDEAPEWVREFLEKKIPWWLEGGGDHLSIVSVNEDRQVARVETGGFIYTLVPKEFRIL